MESAAIVTVIGIVAIVALALGRKATIKSGVVEVEVDGSGDRQADPATGLRKRGNPHRFNRGRICQGRAEPRTSGQRCRLAGLGRGIAEGGLGPNGIPSGTFSGHKRRNRVQNLFAFCRRKRGGLAVE